MSRDFSAIDEMLAKGDIRSAMRALRDRLQHDCTSIEYRHSAKLLAVLLAGSRSDDLEEQLMNRLDAKSILEEAIVRYPEDLSLRFALGHLLVGIPLERRLDYVNGLFSANSENGVSGGLPPQISQHLILEMRILTACLGYAPADDIPHLIGRVAPHIESLLMSVLSPVLTVADSSRYYKEQYSGPIIKSMDQLRAIIDFIRDKMIAT